MTIPNKLLAIGFEDETLLKLWKTKPKAFLLDDICGLQKCVCTTWKARKIKGSLNLRWIQMSEVKRSNVFDLIEFNTRNFSQGHNIVNNLYFIYLQQTVHNFTFREFEEFFSRLVVLTRTCQGVPGIFKNSSYIFYLNLFWSNQFVFPGSLDFCKQLH